MVDCDVDTSETCWCKVATNRIMAHSNSIYQSIYWSREESKCSYMLVIYWLYKIHYEVNFTPQSLIWKRPMPVKHFLLYTLMPWEQSQVQKLHNAVHHQTMRQIISVCLSDIYLIHFTFIRFVIEEPRECCVKCGAIWNL